MSAKKLARRRRRYDLLTVEGRRTWGAIWLEMGLRDLEHHVGRFIADARRLVKWIEKGGKRA